MIGINQIPVAVSILPKKVANSGLSSQALSGFAAVSTWCVIVSPATALTELEEHNSVVFSTL